MAGCVWYDRELMDRSELPGSIDSSAFCDRMAWRVEKASRRPKGLIGRRLLTAGSRVSGLGEFSPSEIEKLKRIVVKSSQRYESWFLDFLVQNPDISSVRDDRDHVFSIHSGGGGALDL